MKKAQLRNIADGRMQDLILPHNMEILVNDAVKLTVTVNQMGEVSVYMRGSKDELYVNQSQSGIYVARRNKSQV